MFLLKILFAYNRKTYFMNRLLRKAGFITGRAMAYYNTYGDRMRRYTSSLYNIA